MLSSLKAFLLGRSIRARVGRFLLLVGLVPLLAMAAYIFVSQRAILSQTANDNLTNHAQLEAASIERVLRDAAGDVEVLASNPVLQTSTASREEKSQQLRQAQDFFDVFEDITLIDPQGNVVDSTTYLYSGTWSEKAWFEEALVGRSAISEAHLIPSPSRLVVVFTAPIFSEGEVSAVVAGQMNMERVWEILDPIPIGRTGFLAAFDRHGNVIAHPDKELLLTRLDGYPESAGSGEATPLRLQGTEQAASLVGQMAPVGLLGWQVAALQERSETYALVNDTVEKVLIAVAVVLLLTVGASVLFSRAISRSISALAAGMHKIAAGSLDERVPSAGLQEIDDLSVSFNTMAANLEGRTAELLTEITERKRAEETVRHRAYHDALTDLPNRTLFKDRLTLALAQARRNQHMLAVMFLDLDRFKVVNDTAGHVGGDRLLQGVGDQLKGLVRDGDTVARVGGDEFTLLLPKITRVEDAVEIAQGILEAFRRLRVVAGHEFHITTSIGITIYPTDDGDAEALLRNADIAMYRAKEEGRSNFQVYAPAMNTQILERLALENDLRHGLEREEFVVYYQPQVNISTGQIVGTEALVRWQHPERGLVSPMEFIPVAEETGLIVPLGEWVLHAACAQNKAWQEAGHPSLRVAVNLSAWQFQQRNLTERVAQVLKETGLDPHWLQLEVTEGDAMQDVDFAIKTLRELKEMGVQIAIDDFGTGHSALNYLSRFPIDVVKIDRSFVCDLTIDANDAEIASTIIVMAHNLNLEVIAEGVETEEQLAFLRQRQCDEMQGYLFSKPVPAEELEEMLAQGKRLRVPTLGRKSR